MLKLPWIKPKTATLPELQEQLENARAAHNAAEQAAGAAQDAFDLDGSATAEKALIAAKDAQRSAAEHLARAERLVAAADELRAAEERAALERRKAELVAELTAEALTDVAAPLAEREADLLKLLVEVRRERLQLGAAVRTKQSELHRIRIALGEELSTSPSSDRSSVEIVCAPHHVTRLLEQHSATLDAKDPARDLLRALFPTRESYFSSNAP